MYAYWAIFDAPQKGYYISGQRSASILRNFGAQFEGGTVVLECCIAYFCKPEDRTRNCFEVRGMRVESNGATLRIFFDTVEEIELESGIVRSGIYRQAKVKAWIAEDEKYSPNLCLMQKEAFDLVRKGYGAVSKYTSISEEISSLRKDNQWSAICAMFEPLDRLEQKNPHDIWNSDGDLYELAYACSKMGELQTEKRRDSYHLSTIQKYREVSIRFYKRCEELSPDDFRYPSALGYRYYKNVIELTQQKGRRDGNADEEIQRALDCYVRVLALRPNSVKDLYRTAKVLEIKLTRYQYAKHRSWSSEELSERDKLYDQIVDFAQRAVNAYHALPENSRSFNKKEYVKALYTMVCNLLERINLREKEYFRARIFDEPVSVSFDPNSSSTKKAMQGLVRAREAMEECCKAELKDFFEKPLEDNDWTTISEKWVYSATIKHYRLGIVYLTMFYIKVVNADERNREELRSNAEKYLRQAGRIGDELRARGPGAPHTGYIKEKLAWLYVLNGDYEQAVRLLRNVRESYAKNTYAIALMRTKDPACLKVAETTLREALADQYNLASSWSATLLCWLYEMTGQEEAKQAIASKYANAMSKTYLKLLASSPEEDDEG